MKEFRTQRLSGDDPQAKVFAPLADGTGFRRMIFPLSRIDSLFECGENITAIRLLNGAVIPAALSLEDLHQRLYESSLDMKGLIDLSDVTGEAARAARKVSFAAQFNETADKAGPEVALDITVFARPGLKDEGYRYMTFRDSHIASFEANSWKVLTETIVKMKASYNGLGSFYITMPIDEFTGKLAEAKEKRLTSINLTHFTHPKSNPPSPV